MTLSLRKFLFADFPYFFKGRVSIELGKGELVELGVRIRNLLEREGITSKIKAAPKGDKVFIALFAQAEQVKKQLEAGGISIDVDEEISIKIEEVGEVYREGMAIIYLYQDKEQNILILLGDDEEALDTAIKWLETGEFRDHLARADLSLYRPEIKPKEEKPKSPR
jgi:hypothetical protein